MRCGAALSVGGRGARLPTHLGARTLAAKSPKSLMRILGPRCNPQARNLFEIVGCLQEREGLQLKVKAVR